MSRGPAVPATAGRAEATVLGFPRIGRDRELKTALEANWSREIDEVELAARAAALGPYSFLRLAKPAEPGTAAPLDHFEALGPLHADLATELWDAGAEDQFDWLLDLPLHRLHLDLVRSPELTAALRYGTRVSGLSLGLVDGRHV